MKGFNCILLCLLAAAATPLAPARAQIPGQEDTLIDKVGEHFPPVILSDPFDTEAEVAKYGHRLKPDSCPELPEEGRPVQLVELVNLTLCRNPETRISWLGLRAAAASLGASKTAYLPSVSAGADLGKSRTHTNDGHFISESSGASISLSYTLFDFGQRDLGIEAAEQSLIASGKSQEANLQNVIATAIQTYYALLAAQDNLLVVREAEALARESRDAAQLRYDLGLAPMSDLLQARASFSSAQLTRENAERTLIRQQALLANSLNLKPDYRITVANIDDSKLIEDSLTLETDRLMEEAKKRRPDLAAQHASLLAARASFKAQRRSGLPTVSVSAGQSFSDIDVFNRDTPRSGSIGISVSIPLFTGFDKPYTLRASRLSLESQEIQTEKSALDVMQDVWLSYQDYQSAEASWVTGWDLLASATELRDVTLGRYKAGIGTMIDVLSAQSSYTAAAQQQLQTRYNLLVSRAALTRALGLLNVDTISPEQQLSVIGEE